MNFFSKLLDVGKSAVNTVKNVGSTIANSFRGTNNQASVFQAVAPFGLSPTQTQGQILTQQAINPAAPSVGLSPKGATSPLSSNVGTQTIPTVQPSSGITVGSTSFMDTTARPSTSTSYINQVDSFGRVSSKDVGQPYYRVTEFGNELITPKVGFSGLSGGGSGFNMSTAASTSPVGSQGITPNTRVSFGGVNPIGTNAITSTSDEEKRIQEENAAATRTLSTPQSTPTPSVAGFNVPTNQPLAVNIPQNIDVGNVEKVSGLLNTLINTPEALTASDVQTLSQNIDVAFSLAKQQLDASTPTPQNPVTDTLEQSQFIESSADPFGVRQALDDFKAQNTNLAELQTSRLDLIKNIQALNSAYTPIIDEIKNNPNLPKALAARRLEQVQKKQKAVLEGFINQLELVNKSITDQNEIVNRAFNIVQFAQSAAEKEQSNNLAKLKLFIDSGAVGAFTDGDIRKWAGLTGISEDTIRAAKKSAASPDINVITETDASGTLRGINKNTGQVVWALPGAGKASVTGGELTPSQQNAAFKLSDDYEANSKSFFTQRDAYNRVIASAQDPSAAGDLALIFNYMKILDPGSTVREGEFATAQNSGSIPNIITAKYNQIKKGERLSDNQRNDFVNRSKKLFNSALQQQKELNNTYANRAAQYGIPANYVIRDINSTSNVSTQNQQETRIINGQSYIKVNGGWQLTQ